MRRQWPWSGWATGAFLFFTAFSTLAILVSRGQRSAWNLMTLPLESTHSWYTFLGYCSLFRDVPIMNENWVSVKQIMYFSGVRGLENMMEFYVLRGYYGLLATLLFPAFDIMTSLMVVNWLAWLACAGAAWKLTQKLFANERAALLAVLFVCGGTGMVFHINDYSAHLLSFATFYWGVYWLYASGVPFQRREGSVHAAIGCYLAVASLTYNTGVMLTAIYALTAFRRNRWADVAGAALFGLAARPLWLFTLHHGLGTPFPDTEYTYLLVALNRWALLWHQSWLAPARKALIFLSECATWDSPLVVLLGLWSLARVPFRSGERRFGIIVIAIPVLCAALYSTATVSRGYLIYGISLWFYCGLAGYLADGLSRSPRPVPWMRLCLIVLCLTTHFYWSTAHWHYWLGPAKSYFLGWTHAWSMIVHAPAQLLSLTGLEPTPRFFGGQASMPEAGALQVNPAVALGTEHVSYLSAFLRRGLLFAYAALWLIASSSSVRRRLMTGAVVLAVAVASSFVSWKFVRFAPWKLTPDHEVRLGAYETLTYRCGVSPRFSAALRDAIAPGDFLFVHLLVDDEHLKVTIRRGRDAATCVLRSPGLWEIIDPGRLFDPGHGTAELSVQVRNQTDHPVWLSGWQREDLPERTLIRASRQERTLWNPGVLPAVEIRLCRPDGSLKVGGF